MKASLPEPLSTKSAAAALALDSTWVMEQKLDGHRILAVMLPTGPRFFNRNGASYGNTVPEAVIDFVSTLPHGITLDGELVDDRYWLFDRLDLHAGHLTKRRFLLEDLLIDSRHLPHPGAGLVPQVVGPTKPHYLDLLGQKNAEGVVFKDTLSVYQPGRTRHWRKYKFEKAADCFVVELDRNGKNAVEVAVYHDGDVVNIGACSTIGKPELKLGDVVEVEYLYLTDSGRLYQPRIKHLRHDKAPEECVHTQLHLTNKKVHTQLHLTNKEDIP